MALTQSEQPPDASQVVGAGQRTDFQIVSQFIELRAHAVQTDLHFVVRRLGRAERHAQLFDLCAQDVDTRPTGSRLREIALELIDEFTHLVEIHGARDIDALITASCTLTPQQA